MTKYILYYKYPTNTSYGSSDTERVEIFYRLSSLKKKLLEVRKNYKVEIYKKVNYKIKEADLII